MCFVQHPKIHNMDDSDVKDETTHTNKSNKDSPPYETRGNVEVKRLSLRLS